MPIAEQMIRIVEASSVIKEMFEEGARLKAEHGPQNVFDFSLGNPDVPPPAAFKATLRKLVLDDNLSHGYTPSPGYLHVRRALAGQLGIEHGVPLRADHLVMTVGAAGALNAVLRSLVNPGEQILTPAPFFVGYNHYAFMANAALRTVATDSTFHLDLPAIEKALNAETRVMLINSPNNPTGAVYSAEELSALSDLLNRASRKFGRRIYLVSDEPYRRIVYDVDVPSVFQVYPHTVVVSSFSKELSLAGERLGYLAVHPQAEDADLIAAAAAVVNTMLCVNAPSLMQLAVAQVQGMTVDISIYRRRRDLFCRALADIGYEFVVPDGAFYLFPKSPIADDVWFVSVLRGERILAVLGSAFGGPGHFRLSYAVPETTISGSLGGFKRVLERI
jgi:aspartate aminotransferase